MARSNAALAAVVPLPSVVFYALFLAQCEISGKLSYSTWECFCIWGSHHPLLLLNLIFFLNVDALFWIISVIQQSTWLIDPYWTVLPVLMTHYFALHPSSNGDPWRSKVVTVLVWIWSIRLTHSYFRRENWQWGAREDWRFAEMRKTYKTVWWWISFFAVYMSQHIFLVGICLPIYAVHQSGHEWELVDNVVAALCAMGIMIAFVADTQLYKFVNQNKKLKERGCCAVEVLDEGIWYYSRHPNYFGEQLWWWSLATFGCRLGFAWTAIGALVNSACLAYVTVLVERKIVANESRAAAYRNYQKCTSVWIPWFKFLKVD